GALAVAVPGEVRGLGEMVRRWGALPFKRCADPARRLATQGFPISWHLSRALSGLESKAGAGGGAGPDPKFVEVFANKILAKQETWRRPDLAWTLDQLRTGGAEAFYKGPVAYEIVKAVHAAGGVMTAGDLEQYQPV